MSDLEVDAETARPAPADRQPEGDPDAETPPRRMISMVFSFRNEETVLDELLERLEPVLAGLPYDYELIFVNDASTDGSLELLEKRGATDPHIRVITMSSRFGISPCILAGMAYARGDAVITMDADLQDPPEILPRFIKEWEQGADVVYGTRTVREGESALKMLLTRWAYHILQNFSSVDLPVNTGMFRLMSVRVVDTLLAIPEKDPFLRGLVSWVGYRQAQIFYKREPRASGETHFPLFSKAPAKEFIIGMMSFSRLTLLFLIAGGFVTIGGTLIALFAFAVARAGASDIPLMYAGIAFLAFLSGVQLLASAVLWLYLARIYNQVRSRPEYIVASTFGFEEPVPVGPNARWRGTSTGPAQTLNRG